MITRVVLLGIFSCTLSVKAAAPVVTAVNPPPGTVAALTQITVTFSTPVAGLDSDDFLIDGFPADTVSGSGTNFTFTFLQPPYGLVQIGWRATNGITDLAVPPHAFDQTAPSANWLYTLIDVVPPSVTLLFPPAGATVQSLAQIEVSFSEDVVNLDATDLLINSQPATSVTHAPGEPFVFHFPPPAPGNVSIAWVPGHGITDLASPPNSFAGGAWSYTVNPNAGTRDLIINEFLANNEIGLLDEDGEAQGWIEILNRGTNTVNLENWALSDDDTLPGLWSFPALNIAPGQYLVVFASGKDRKPVTGPNRMHTNFKLNGNGEHLGLYSPDSPRVLVHGFSPGFPEQRNDNSYGYDANGALRYFATPTPGGPNGLSTVVGVVEPVHFGVSRGFFTQPLNLVLSCPTPGGQIRYTTDGSQPTELAGRLYFQPLRLVSNAVIRAIAFRTNHLPSVSITHTYLFNATAAIRSLPVVSLVTASNNLYGPSGIVGISGGTYSSGVWQPLTTNDYHNTDKHGVAWERPLSAELINPADNSGFQVNCGIRVHGSDYTRPRYLPTDKFAYRLYFRGAYGPGKLEYPFFAGSAVQKFDQIILRAGHNDVNPFIRDEMTRRLHNNLGAVNIHGNLVNLFINGEYKGFFNPTERPDENWIQSWYQSEQRWDVIKQFSSVVNGDLVEYNNFNSYLRTADLNSPAIYQEVARRFDLTNFVDYLCLNVYEDMGDWPANNWVMGRERTASGIWRYYVWDGEWGCGIYGRAVTRNTFAMSGGGPDDSGLSSTNAADIARQYQKLYTSAEFRLLFADRIHRNFFNNGALTDTNVSLMHESLRQQMLPVLPTYDNSIATIWIPQRRAIMMGLYNLYGLIASSNAPVFNQFGGRVPGGFNLTMVATNGGGTIYFTTNGGDPRVMFTGAVASNAAAYTAPVVLGQTTVVRARTLLGTNWSALTEASFEVASLGIPLRITEIMYNPTGGSVHEFIELQNVGPTPIDVSGFYFEGITFTFPPNSSIAPGARIVLAANTDPVSFAARYPGVTVFGYYAGNLNNAGERITLNDRGGNIIVSVDYDDENGWATAADGGGSSLELIDLNGDPDDPANWQASASSGGTPGAANSTPPVPAILLNEIMAENGGAVDHNGTFPDWVELYNPGVTTVSLADWSLTDDGNARKFVFPAGTQIPAGGYLVIWCDDATNTTPGLHAGFSLNRSGDTVVLYGPATNRVDIFTFGLQLTNYTIGRIGQWQLTAPTPGAANLAASINSASALSINEWLANAPAGQSDWIELYNTSVLPVALRGVYLATTTSVHRITSHSYVPPFGFVQLFADEGVGPDHLDFKLPAVGGSIVLYDATATEVDRVTYTNAVEGLTRGRLPDGTATVVNFPGSASPGASNYVNTYTGPVLNEILARNQSAVTNAGRVADYIELYNSNAAPASLAGMSLSVNSAEPGQWLFPAGASVPANGYLVIWCDGSRPASFIAGDYNTGQSLNGESGGAYLFNAQNQVVNTVEYGFQVRDLPIGLSGGQWRLLASATPGAANADAAALGTNAVLRFNEWMANPASGADWFELFNPTNLPVELTGLYLTDDPSLAGRGQFRVAANSFIGPNGFVQWIADGDADQGRNHVNFGLDAEGESLWLFRTTNFNLIDAITFDTQQLGVSEGRLPDGQANIVRFVGSATPAESNYLPLPGVVVNEALPHTDPPLEDAVELRNTSGGAVGIGGWFLSDSQDDFRKYRIPDGTTLAAGGFTVVYQNQFSNGSPTSFTFDSAHGDEVWLSEADAAGNLTGYRAAAKFGASANGVSFGRVTTSVGVDYVAMSQRTFGVDTPVSLAQFRTGTGLANAAPLVGPVVINELMYHPLEAAGFTGDDEYVELRNVTGASVALFDAAHPTNTWRLAGGVEFVFPSSASLAASGFALVVPFDPANVVLRDSFRTKYGVSVAVPLFGPYTGKLDNGGENVELFKPDPPQPPGAPDAGFVPYVLVDRVDYRDTAPWPSGAVDGGGLSLQRLGGAVYGNEPLNWVASAPTPGAANGAGVVPQPVITSSPQSQSVLEGAAPTLTVTATGTGPLGYQWRFNGTAVPNATNAALALDYAILDNDGDYDCIVSNPGGAALSATARLSVRAPVTVLVGPTGVTTRPGSNVVFTVSARGSAPLRYQWRLNGVTLPGETNVTVLRTNVQLADDGDYEVLISNPVSAASATARLVVLVAPAFIQPPLGQIVVEGSDFSHSVEVSGNPMPIAYSWRRALGPNSILASNYVYSRTNFITLNSTAAGLVLASGMASSNYELRLVVFNEANPAPGVLIRFTNTVVADFDRDGIPDVVENALGLNTNNPADAALDSDGDGMSNRDEYIAGTDPANPASYLKITSIAAGGGATVTFGAISNKTYSIQYSEGLGSGVWAKLKDIVAVRTNHIETVFDPNFTTNRFYRVATPRQP